MPDRPRLTPLRRLARAHGIALAYDHGPVPDATLRTILSGLGVAADAHPPTAAPEPADLVAAHLPPWLTDRPAWGVFCQLYELRSARNWGIGDFADLAELARLCGAAGADFLGVNPLHALFAARPGHASPFSPSNRRFLNPLYVAPDALGCAEPDLAALRAADRVDYAAVSAIKMQALRQAFDAFPGAPAFDAFVAEGGEPLRLHALHEVISTLHGGAGWPDWPAALREPTSPEVARLAADRTDDLRFHLWLQWVARTQLAEAQRAALDAGMRLGLYLDLAVGEAPDGSATWSGVAARLPGVTVGAPPDMFSTTGQGWGLAAPSPVALREAGFEPFRAMIRAQLRDAGALRIDHAMALRQLFLIPDGAPPRDGAHLRYPLPDLMRVLAEESHAAGAVVIGEDLGWVPDGFREAMAAANVLSYRIAVFEQDAEGFVPPEAYPSLALACLSTHDLPVLSQWWRGDDIARRETHGLIPPEDAEAQRAHRRRERRWMLRWAGLTADPRRTSAPPGLTEAAYRTLARAPSRLVGVRLADLAGPEAPTNVPGVTEDAYPNWRPRSPTPLADLARAPMFRAVTAALSEARPR